MTFETLADDVVVVLFFFIYIYFYMNVSFGGLLKHSQYCNLVCSENRPGPVSGLFKYIYIFFLSFDCGLEQELKRLMSNQPRFFWGSWWDVTEMSACCLGQVLFRGFCLFFYLCTVSVPKNWTRELQSAYSGGETSSVAR